MKVIIFLVVWSMVLITSVYAEQKIIKVYDQSEYIGQQVYGPMDCDSFCGKQSDGNINSYLNSGWNIIGFKTIVNFKSPFKTNDTCRCRGTEYILEKR